jgi:undecaprenyl pyrophosphate phosphatase UppP
MAVIELLALVAAIPAGVAGVLIGDQIARWLRR